jgi:hypothetical protein
MSQELLTDAAHIEYELRGGTEKHNTPLEFVKPIAEAVGGFDLDPCASQTSHLAKQNIRESGGLEADWNDARTVFLNHPYGNGEPAKWLSKAAQTAGDTLVVALSRGDPSADWFEFITEADLVCFPDERISFAHSNSTPRFANVVSVFGPYPKALREHLGSIGWIARENEAACLDSSPPTQTELGLESPETLFELSAGSHIQLTVSQTGARDRSQSPKSQKVDVTVLAGNARKNWYSVLTVSAECPETYYMIDIKKVEPHTVECTKECGRKRHPVTIEAVEVRNRNWDYPDHRMTSPDALPPVSNALHPSSIAPRSQEHTGTPTIQTKLPSES